MEIERNTDVPEHLIQMFKDLSNLTEHAVEDWSVEYFKPRKSSKLELEALKSIIPSTPESYRNLVKNQQTDLDKLKTAAGVKVDTKAPKNDFTEGIRTLAGICR